MGLEQQPLKHALCYQFPQWRVLQRDWECPAAHKQENTSDNTNYTTHYSRDKKNNKTIEMHARHGQVTSDWMFYLRIGNGNSGGVLGLPKPGVLDVMDLGVIGLNVSHTLPSRWPPEPLARWEHLLWKEGKCEGKCWSWRLLHHNTPLTFIHPVWDPIKNLIFHACVSDLLWWSCRTAHNIQIVIPHISLKTEWKAVIWNRRLKDRLVPNQVLPFCSPPGPKRSTGLHQECLPWGIC